MSKSYSVVNGILIKDTSDKEELLEIIISYNSSHGIPVNYRELKENSAEELLEKVKRLSLNFNRVVYEYDINNNLAIHKATLSSDGRTLKFCGKTFVIETFETFKQGLEENSYEGNPISGYEKRILTDIETIENTK